MSGVAHRAPPDGDHASARLSARTRENVVDYRGEVVVEHGGSIDGMRALVSTIAERGVGLVVLTNRGDQLLPEVVRYYVYDALLGFEPKDWSTDLLARVAKARDEERAAREKIEAGRVADTRPSRALEDYAGLYESAIYGRAAVESKNGALVLRRGSGFEGELEHGTTTPSGCAGATGSWGRRW